MAHAWGDGALNWAGVWQHKPASRRSGQWGPNEHPSEQITDIMRHLLLTVQAQAGLQAQGVAGAQAAQPHPLVASKCLRQLHSLWHGLHSCRFTGAAVSRKAAGSEMVLARLWSAKRQQVQAAGRLRRAAAAGMHASTLPGPAYKYSTVQKLPVPHSPSRWGWTARSRPHRCTCTGRAERVQHKSHGAGREHAH